MGNKKQREFRPASDMNKTQKLDETKRMSKGAFSDNPKATK